MQNNEKLPEDAVDKAMSDASFTRSLQMSTGNVTNDKRVNLKKLLEIKNENKTEKKAPIVSQKAFSKKHNIQNNWGARRRKKK